MGCVSSWKSRLVDYVFPYSFTNRIYKLKVHANVMFGIPKVGKGDAEDEKEEDDAPDEPEIAEDVYEDDFEEGGEEDEDQDDGDEIVTEIESAASNSISGSRAESVPTVL